MYFGDIYFTFIGKQYTEFDTGITEVSVTII